MSAYHKYLGVWVRARATMQNSIFGPVYDQECGSNSLGNLSSGIKEQKTHTLTNTGSPNSLTYKIKSGKMWGAFNYNRTGDYVKYINW